MALAIPSSQKTFEIDMNPAIPLMISYLGKSTTLDGYTLCWLEKLHVGPRKLFIILIVGQTLFCAVRIIHWFNLHVFCHTAPGNLL